MLGVADVLGELLTVVDGAVVGPPASDPEQAAVMTPSSVMRMAALRCLPVICGLPKPQRPNTSIVAGRPASGE